jgi:hypothetical protein
MRLVRGFVSRPPVSNPAPQGGFKGRGFPPPPKKGEFVADSFKTVASSFKTIDKSFKTIGGSFKIIAKSFKIIDVEAVMGRGAKPLLKRGNFPFIYIKGVFVW